LINNVIFVVTEYSHVKPGKGSAFVRVKLKNLKTDQVLEKTFKTADKLADAVLEERKLQNLYRSGDTFHFMDNTTFEEVMVSVELVGNSIKFLQDNLEVAGVFCNNEIQKINLPIFIEAEIIHTEPGFKGDSSRAGNKPSEIDTGTTIQVPLFIEIGDFVKIDTRTGSYVERIKK
jgi:elongation factor P